MVTIILVTIFIGLLAGLTDKKGTSALGGTVLGVIFGIIIAGGIGSSFPIKCTEMNRQVLQPMPMSAAEDAFYLEKSSDSTYLYQIGDIVQTADTSLRDKVILEQINGPYAVFKNCTLGFSKGRQWLSNFGIGYYLVGDAVELHVPQGSIYVVN